MKILISPAKTLDFDTKAQTRKHTEPKFKKETAELISVLEKLKSKDIAKLMHLSPKLADLNFERFQTFVSQPRKQAVLAFNGDVYAGLEAADFNEEDLEFAQEHLRILSGLYGMLRPLDLMQAYRLEMGTALKTKNGKNLYEFWGDKLTREIGDEPVINLASVEYFSAVKPKNSIDIVFKENKHGKFAVVAIFAKKARGMMARYIIKNRITDVGGIKKFKDGGYKFNKEMSNEHSLVFVR